MTAVAPMRAVLDAIADGASSSPEVSAATQLDIGVVRAAMDQLVRLGRLEVTVLGRCSTGGCGTCPSGPGKNC